MSQTPAPPRFRYAVVRIGPEWRVVCARRAMGHFTTRDAALNAAGGLAREALLAGHVAEVLVQSESGELQATSFSPR
ncbi:MAG: hypothetical protein K9G59_05855 [Caulobacter sp.]|nr:hypothetical protein [Caulobacter sp.]